MAGGTELEGCFAAMDDLRYKPRVQASALIDPSTEAVIASASRGDVRRLMAHAARLKDQEFRLVSSRSGRSIQPA